MEKLLLMTLVLSVSIIFLMIRFDRYKKEISFDIAASVFSILRYSNTQEEVVIHLEVGHIIIKQDVGSYKLSYFLEEKLVETIVLPNGSSSYFEGPWAKEISSVVSNIYKKNMSKEIQCQKDSMYEASQLYKKLKKGEVL